nr:enoyl-CoA hydratase/isomerase family protein [Pseudomonas sp.]
MANTPLTLERCGAVARLRFTRPEALNAINADMAQALVDSCRALSCDTALRAVVISGEGRGFMAGGDLNELRQEPVAAAQRIIEPLHESTRLLTGMPVPVIASVHGVVAGAGLSLMMAADLAIAAAGTRFNFAYTHIGTSCDAGASWALPRLVGLRKAMEIALYSEPFDADEALRLGLLTKVVPETELAVATSAMAERLVGLEPTAVTNLKQLLRSSLDQSLKHQLDAEQAAFVDCVSQPGFVAAVEAFFARRPTRGAG